MTDDDTSYPTTPLQPEDVKFGVNFPSKKSLTGPPKDKQVDIARLGQLIAENDEAGRKSVGAASLGWTYFPESLQRMMEDEGYVVWIHDKERTCWEVRWNV